MDFVRGASPPVLVLTHANADPDAVASAVILGSILSEQGLEGSILAFPEGPSRLSRKILSKLDLHMRYLKAPPEHKYRAVAVVDATNAAQLSEFRQVVDKAERLLVIDHHLPSGDLVAKATHPIVGEEPATVVLVCQTLEELAVRLQPNLATLALAGLLFDSRRFALATPTALRTAAYLIERGGSYETALSLLEEAPPFSERVARLKGVLRSQILKVNGFLVALSEIGSFEASVARSLVALGADVALVASERKGECRLSVRLSKGFMERTGISASRDIAAEVANKIGGKGGGHDAAGSYIGTCRTSQALREALLVLTSKLAAKATPLR